MGRIRMSWPAGTQDAVKERLRAVAWATKQVDGWESPNVVQDLTTWLEKDGYQVPQTQVADAMLRMHKARWAIRVVRGKRTTGFVLSPDLVVETPAYVQARLVKASGGQPATNGSAAAVVKAARPPAQRRMPPLPGTSPAAEPAWLPLITAGLVDYWRDDPASADAWAEQALDMLTGPQA